MASETVYWGQRALAEISSIGTSLANVSGAAGQTSVLVTGNINASNSITTGNLITNNIVMSSNMSSSTGFGNVYFSGNLVVTGNIFSSGGSVGSGSGTSQGILYSTTGYTLGSPFYNVGTSNGYHINFTSLTPEAAQAVTQFGAGTGMLKFTTAGLYQLTCVLAGDQPVLKVAVGKTTTGTWPPPSSPTYDYVYNYPLNSSPSELVTIPLTVTDITQYYFLDVYFNTSAGNPTQLYKTRSTTATGYNFGTYVQVAPFGNYLTSATGVAAALLANCSASSNLSGVYSSNTYRIALTSANGWTVNGTSTSLAVTSNGNFQVNQSGIYEVNLCLNTVGQTACQFQVGSLSSDAASPGGTTPLYLYTYAPMYTQDPTTAIKLPLNITNISNVYFVECSFPGTLTGNVVLQTTSTFVSIKPIGGYINTGTNPWSQQGTSVYYNGGSVGIGGAVPTALTETLTVNGNTSFVSNVTVTSDASANNYVVARRVPTGSLDVTQYVTGSAPLTTTTNLIQKYLSNAAAVVTSAPTYNPALSLTNTTGTTCNLTSFNSSHYDPTSSNIFVEAWIYASSFPNNPSIFTIGDSSADDLGLYISAASGLQAYISNTTASTTNSGFVGGASVGLTTWTHVAMSWNYNAKTIYAFRNGTASTAGTMSVGTPRYTASRSVYIGDRAPFNGGSTLNGYVYDLRVIKGSTVPTASFTAPATPAVFSQTTLPSYTGLSALSGNVIALALQSQYFPGASTSPYGPCLTLPGTVGSYYSQSAGTHSDWKGTGGFTLEAWVNYASLANSNIFGAASSIPSTIGAFNGGNLNINYSFGALTSGQLGFLWVTAGGTGNSFVTSNTLTTGSWNHILVQSNASNVYMAINGNFTTLTAQGFAPTAGNTTIAPTIAPSTSYAVYTNPVTIGQWNLTAGPNVSVARARLIYGANVYSSGSFTPSPNFATSAVAPFWQLESQYPLPTYPSFFDVPVLSAQTPAYGAEPVVVGGVTSNVLGPYPGSYPQFDSIRFDGTGYIDYGNAASSALTTNLWANAWTIEGWVYLNNLSGTSSVNPIFGRNGQSSGYYDLLCWVHANGTIYLSYGNTSGTSASVSGGTVALNTWTHIAVTYDGVRSNIYSGTSGTVAIVGGGTATNTSYMSFSPTFQTQVGFWNTSFTTGNLADVRVSNVARYTGSSYTVPTAPFTTDSNTLLLLKSVAGQVGTTLEVQGRGLGSVSLGAGRTVQAYPPAPMSSYLLDTTSNALVTYGQGKYVASASSEYSSSYVAWQAFNKVIGANGVSAWVSAQTYASSISPSTYTGSLATVDTLGNSYSGEWLQIQTPVSIILSSYAVWPQGDTVQNTPYKFWILGSRDGINWTLVDARNGVTWTMPAVAYTTFTPSTTQGYNYFRFVVNSIQNSVLASGPSVGIAEWTLNGTEESLCVTSDSKVGVGIANPQRALEVAGDLVVGGTISGGAGMGMYRNRVINGDMRIAQRGTSNAVPTNGAYMIDRFIVNSSVAATQTQQTLTSSDTPYQLGFKNSLKTTVNSGVNFATAGTGYLYPCQQFIEAYNVQDLNWGTSFGSPVTLSFWVRSNIPSGSSSSVTIYNALNGSSTGYAIRIPFTYYTTATWQYVTITCPPPPNGSPWNTGTGVGLAFTISAVNYNTPGSTINANPNVWESTTTSNRQGLYNDYLIAQTVGNYIEFTGVQLEKGTVATPFEFRNYETELFQCQTWNGNSTVTGSSAVCLNTTGGNVGIGTTNPANNVQIGSPVDTIYAMNPLSQSNVIIFGNSPSMPTYTGTGVGGATLFINSTNAYGSNVGASIALGGRSYNFGGGNLHMTYARLQGVQNPGTGAYAGDFVIETHNSGNMYERMRITYGGNVGIGTTNPVYALDVGGAYTTFTQYAGMRAQGYVSAAYTTGTINNGSNGTYSPNTLGNYGGIFYFTVTASDNGSMFSSGIAYNWNPNLQSASVFLTQGGVAVDAPAGTGVLRITNNTGAARSFFITILNTKA